MIPEDIKRNVKNASTWERALPMVVYFMIHYFINETILLAITIIQFFSQLIFLRRLPHLYDFSVDLANYDRNIWLYLNYTSDKKLFPFGDWRDSCRIDDSNRASSEDSF